MNRMISALFVLLFLLLQIHSLQAQRFTGSLILGLNLSELFDGDDIDHYRGFNTGARVTAKLQKKWKTSMEFLFSQQADYISLSYAPVLDFEKIKLNYIEIPIQIEYYFYPSKNGYYKGTFTWGAGYARLFHWKAIAKGNLDISKELLFKNKNALFFHLAAGGNFTKHIGFDCRWSLATNWNWTLAVRGIYRI